MKDHIENCNTTSDMYETLNPNNQKDFDKDNINSYSWNVALRGFIDKDDKLDITSWDIYYPAKLVDREPSPLLNINTEQTVKHLETLAKKAFSNAYKETEVTKAAEKMIAYTKNTAALNYIFNKSQGETESIRDAEIALKLNSIHRRLSSLKILDIAVCGCNSVGAVITSAHILTISLDRESFLLFSKLVSKSKFFKEAVSASNGRLLYKFNIKVYDKHELNMDQTLSNYSDIFVKWYLSLCSEENSRVLNIDAISELATRLFDDDWCQLDSIMYQK